MPPYAIHLHHFFLGQFPTSIKKVATDQLTVDCQSDLACHAALFEAEDDRQGTPPLPPFPPSTFILFTASSFTLSPPPPPHSLPSLRLPTRTRFSSMSPRTSFSTTTAVSSNTMLIHGLPSFVNTEFGIVIKTMSRQSYSRRRIPARNRLRKRLLLKTMTSKTHFLVILFSIDLGVYKYHLQIFVSVLPLLNRLYINLHLRTKHLPASYDKKVFLCFWFVGASSRIYERTGRKGPGEGCTETLRLYL